MELITDYVEDALGPELSSQVSAHLSGCAGCGVYLDQIRTTSAALGSVQLAGLSYEACADLVDAFGDWPDRRP